MYPLLLASSGRQKFTMKLFSPNSAYRQQAESTMDFIQQELWDSRVHRYRPAFPMKTDSLPYDFMWGNGTAFSALVGGTKLNPRKYHPVMESFFQGIEAHWDKDAPIPAYDAYFASPNNDDKYYDDNAWMVITFTEAYTLTGDKRYLFRAAEVMRYVLSGWDDRHGGGIYWRQERKAKTTCSNGPSATAALALAAHLNDRYYIGWAKKIVEWTTVKLQAPDGLFWDGMGYTGGIGKTCWTYNTALMLRANLGLYRFTGEPKYLDASKRMGEASEKLFVNRDTGAFRDDAMFSHLLVEAFLDLYQETREKYLLDRARANGDFAWKYVRDSRDGGFWKTWKIEPNRKEERKTMIANTSTARLFWLLAAQEEQGKETRTPRAI